MEAIWTYRSVGLIGLPSSTNPNRGNSSGVDDAPASQRDQNVQEHLEQSLVTGTNTLRELLSCDDRHARAAATKQLRYWYTHLDDAIDLLNRSAGDVNGVVRMQAAITATYIGTQDALEAILDVFDHPRDGHLQYAITSALGSRTLRPHWENDDRWGIAKRLQQAAKDSTIKEPTPGASDAQFDSQKNVNVVKISCVPEKMLFSVKNIKASPGQPVKIVFTNTDATDHNLVIVKEDQKKYSVASNLLTPNSLTEVRKRDVEIKSASKVSSMPAGLLDVLTKDEILDLQVYVESGGYHLPDHIEHRHHGAKESEK